MAYYKVPQDVEAEDKLVFGLTFKQFIFAIIFFVSGFLGFKLASTNIFFLGLFLPIFLMSGILAFYRPKDQPAETKLVAYVNYFFRPRQRTWSRDGLLEHVTIQAPPLPQQGPLIRSQAQVRSQLTQLAQIVDTRGWATKHSTIQLPTVGTATLSHDDRLITPQEVHVINTPLNETPALDIFDEATNPQVSLIEQREEETRRQALDEAKAKMHRAQEVAAAAPVKISEAHAIGPSAEPPQPETSTPLTPRFKPWPDMRQRVIDPTTKQLQQLSEDDDRPVSVIAQQANRISNQNDGGTELKIEH